MNTLIKNATLGDKKVDLLIENNRIKKIDAKIEDTNAQIVDATDQAVMPAFYNMHTHAAMTLLRGYSEGLPLFDWLNNIWKKEATMTAEDIYVGTRLAILEMIKTGTVYFADMYWFHAAVAKAAEDMGVRANVGITFMDSLDRKTIDANFDFAKNYPKSPERMVEIGIAPHAIYTCSGDLYKECFEFAKTNELVFQTHLAETQKEVEDSLTASGMRPVEYLDSLGVLSDNMLCAHCVHLSRREAEIMAERGATLVHNPCSNMKLASGVFDSKQAKECGCSVALGTDGTSSNNNLSMMEEMKFASLLAKSHYADAQALNAEEVYRMATVNGARAVGLDAGEIREGALADLILVNLRNERLVPDYDLVSHLVYSADSAAIDSVMCNGKFLMRGGVVKGEEEIIEAARRFNR